MSFQPHAFIPDFGPEYRFDESGKERANCLGSDDFNTTTLQLKGPTQLVNYDGNCTEYTDDYQKWECLKRSGKATFAYSIGTLLTGKGGTRMPDMTDPGFAALNRGGDVAKGPSGPIGSMYLAKGFPAQCTNHPNADKYKYENHIPKGISTDKSVSSSTRGILPGMAETLVDFAGDFISSGDLLAPGGMAANSECVPYSVWTIDTAPSTEAGGKGEGSIYRCCTQVNLSRAQAAELEGAGVKDCREELKQAGVANAETINYNADNPYEGTCMCQKIDAYGINEGMANMQPSALPGALRAAAPLLLLLVALCVCGRL